ncbi:MAG: hypothetical protein GWP10_09880 [Nitrospiraceae bacterium]|nr:hypothetical protein [Nitrospiraceae bacterium]
MTKIRKPKNRITTRIRRFFSFFPVQLLLGYLKNNHLILLSWLLPFLIVAGVFGSKYGIPSLYLAPEYMGTVSSWAFLFVGLATGSFIMAFHISSYTVMVHRYPFIVTVTKPFYVYSLNNSAIPFSYLLYYLYRSAYFQHVYELIPSENIFIHLLSFLTGVLIFVFFSFGFFFVVVRGIPSLFHFRKRFLKKHPRFRWLQRISEQDKRLKIKEAPIHEDDPSRVEIYMPSFTRLAKTGRFKQYNEEQFTAVFHYQHRNALYYIIFILAFILLRGLFKNQPALILPAGASIQLMLTVILLFTSLLYIVFQRWTFMAIIVLLFIAAYASPGVISSYNNNAYGMSYHKSHKLQIKLLDHGNFRQDSLQTIGVLNAWKLKNTNPKYPGQKPRMVIVCTSGGGMKMAVWTYYTLATADSTLNGNLMKRTQLITGASGGMIGAAYWRELLLHRKQQQYNTSIRQHVEKLATDILNPVAYTFSMSDWFFRLQHFKYNGKKYFVDRAYMFEKTINRNLGSLLDKPLYAYRKPEEKAIIPMLILTPTIENTGAQLVISPLNVSYLVKNKQSPVIKNIELRHNYQNFGADSLRFLSALRMNASFPYVSPDVNLPGNPRLVVMDAGLNDNYGFMTAIRFITEFKDWINANTSGLILIRLDENDYTNYNMLHDALNRIMRPLGSLFGDWSYIQEINFLSMATSLNKMLTVPVWRIRFSFGSAKNHISLSWHLNRSEKESLLRAIHNRQNQDNITRLKQLLDSSR